MDPQPIIKAVWVYRRDPYDISSVVTFATRREAMVHAYREFGAKVLPKEDVTLQTLATPEECIAYLKKMLPNYTICGPHGDDGRFANGSTYPSELEVKVGDVDIFSYYDGNVSRGPSVSIEQVIVLDSESYILDASKIKGYLEALEFEGGFQIQAGWTMESFESAPKRMYEANLSRLDALKAIKVDVVPKGTKLYYDERRMVAYLEYDDFDICDIVV
jgi:hypothetical protein